MSRVLVLRVVIDEHQAADATNLHSAVFAIVQFPRDTINLLSGRWEVPFCYYLYFPLKFIYSQTAEN